MSDMEKYLEFREGVYHKLRSNPGPGAIGSVALDDAKAICDEVDGLLRSEHDFRQALRHVETEMKSMSSALRTSMRAVSTALDDPETETGRGMFVNIPRRNEDEEARQGQEEAAEQQDASEGPSQGPGA